MFVCFCDWVNEEKQINDIGGNKIIKNYKLIEEGEPLKRRDRIQGMGICA